MKIQQETLQYLQKLEKQIAEKCDATQLPDFEDFLERLESLELKVQSQNQQIKLLETSLQTEHARIELLETTVSLKTRTTEVLQEQISELRTRHDRVEQYSMRPSLRINGLVAPGPTETNADVLKIVKDIGDDLGVMIDEGDIFRAPALENPSLRPPSRVSQLGGSSNQ